MADWQKLVSHRLAALKLDDREREEIFTELAGHLEETYDVLRRSGLTEYEAVRRAVSQVTNWEELQHNIYSARTKENPMNARTSRLWLPSLVTLALSFVTLVLVGFLGLNPGPLGSHTLLPRHAIYVVSDYTVWLMALPLVGALGARLSARAGGTLRDVIISGVSPALGWLTIVLLILSAAALREHGLEAATSPLGPIGIVTVLVLIPGACLLVGVLAYDGLTKWRRKMAA